MLYLLWLGIFLIFSGVTLLVVFITRVMKLKKQNVKSSSLSDENFKSQLSKLIPLNLVAIFLAMLGFLSVLIGLLLSP